MQTIVRRPFELFSYRILYTPNTLETRGVHPPWGNDAFPPVSDFPPISEKISIFICQHFWWPSLVIDYKFWISPLFSMFQYISPLFRVNYYCPLLFQISPCFRKIYVFFVLCVFVSPLSLTVMHLCITQCTYWTPLPLCN